MKSFIRIKKIKGHEYLYEITPFYDKEKKQIRQKSKYLGKNINGVPVKVRTRDQMPKKILSHGEFVLLKQIVEKLKLEAVLSEIFPSNDVWAILTLAMNYAIRPKSLIHIQSWYEGTILSEDHPDLPLSFHNLSRMLSSIGEGTTILEFSHKFIQQVSTSETLIYDITSLSSYSQKTSFTKFGCNRDDLDLPPVNLALIVDKDLGIPIMYDLSLGGISDATALKNTVKKMNAQGVRNRGLIMDRGFFSTENIDEMVSADLPFIIPPTNSIKKFKEAISNINRTIDNPENLNIYEKEPLFVMPISIDIGENMVEGYAYYDQKLEQHERNIFYKRLYDLMTVLRSKKLKPWLNPGEVFRATAKKDAKFIEWKAVDGKFQVSLKKNTILQAVNKMGKFILLYRGEFSWIDCLSLYKSKDVVEKRFDVLKNDIDIIPANATTASSLRGYIFIVFLALILRMKLTKIMIGAGLNKKYSVDGLLTELEKIKIMILPNGKRITTEVTKEQHEILDALHICA
ncbi:MAG: Transposase DDE domain protein [Methanosaeta sp. PtaU1.Bin112]|nr:MAG: Transposase DDE domain protein [Methanosaeta sp. PtaU1.Bin112]